MTQSRAGPLSAASVRREHGDLTELDELVVGPQLRERLRRATHPGKQLESAPAVPPVGERLRRDRTDAGASPRNRRAGVERLRLHRDPELAARRVARDDRVGHAACLPWSRGEDRGSACRADDPTARPGHLGSLRGSRRAAQRGVGRLLVHLVPHAQCREDPYATTATARSRNGWFEEDRAHAALVFDGEVAVGWCQFGAPDELPNINHRKEYEAGVERAPDYRLTCFFVDKRYRRQGVAAAALGGALELIAQSWWWDRRGLPAGHRRQEDHRFLPLQRHPQPLRAGWVHLFPPQGQEPLRDGQDG